MSNLFIFLLTMIGETEIKVWTIKRTLERLVAKYLHILRKIYIYTPFTSPNIPQRPYRIRSQLRATSHISNFSPNPLHPFLKTRVLPLQFYRVKGI